MKQILLIIIFTISSKSIACNFSGFPPILEEDSIKDKVVTDCSIFSWSDEALCDCAQKNISKFNIPKLDKLPDYTKKAYIFESLELTEKNLLEITHEMVSLSNHPKFQNDTKLGKACDITKLSEIECENGSLLSKTKIK